MSHGPMALPPGAGPQVSSVPPLSSSGRTTPFPEPAWRRLKMTRSGVSERKCVWSPWLLFKPSPDPWDIMRPMTDNWLTPLTLWYCHSLLPESRSNKGGYYTIAGQSQSSDPTGPLEPTPQMAGYHNRVSFPAVKKLPNYASIIVGLLQFQRPSPRAPPWAPVPASTAASSTMKPARPTSRPEINAMPSALAFEATRIT